MLKVPNTIIKDSHILVLGSAPKPAIPACIDKKWQIVCVNASGWSAHQLKLPTPLLTVLSGHVLTKSTVEASREALRNLETKQLLLITYGASETDARKSLQSLSYSYEELITIDRIERAKIIQKVVRNSEVDGFKGKKPSNGIFAAIYCLYHGAREVVLAGFSLEQNNKYNYTSASHGVRNHIETDIKALNTFAQCGAPIYTSESSIAEHTNVSIVSSIHFS